MRGKPIKSALFLLVILLGVFNPAAGQSTPNLNVNAAISYQTMDGVGSNVHAWSWKNGELRPALDMLIDTLGHNIFRVVHDRMDWAGSGSTRPATTLANLYNLDLDTLQSVYEVPDMQDLWNTIGYLNSKGVSGDQIIVNFMGWTAPWMGGGGGFGIPSYISNDAQTNQDMATMIASLVYYGHHRRDVSGANQNLEFNYIAPFNEPDYNALEGPGMSGNQMNAIYEDIAATLSAMGDATTQLSGPDTAGSPDPYTADFSQAVRARMTHFSWHSYNNTASSPAASRGGISADWMTETSLWCGECNNNQPTPLGEWLYGSIIGDILLGDIQNGFSAVLTWEGFDTFYYHDNMYMAWGHLGCTQNGSGCTTSDAISRVYSIRTRAWPEAAIARAVRPGMVRRGLTTTIPNLTALSFYDVASGDFSIAGHNQGGSAITINGVLQNLPAIDALSLYVTNASSNLQRMDDVTVVGSMFTATIPADSFFYLFSPTDSNLPQDFTKLLPEDDPLISWPINALTLSWAPSAGSAGYYYCVDETNNSTCDAGWHSFTVNTQVQPAGLEVGKTYYWQIKATNTTGELEANSGTWWRFSTIDEMPASFSKTYPPDDALNIPLIPVLDWSPSLNADHYEYCVSASASCPGEWTIGTTDTFVQLPTLAYNTDYYWQVRAINSVGETEADNGVWHVFKTRIAPPAYFEKFSPSNNHLGTPLNVILEWNASTGSAGYYYCVDETNNSTCDAGWHSFTVNTQVQPAGLESGKTYYWQIKATNTTDELEANSGTWWRFTTVDETPSNFSKTYPLDIALDIPLNPMLDWSPSLNADHYEYCVSASGSCLGEWTIGTTDTFVQLPTLAYDTLYYWQVRAVNGGNIVYPADSGWWSFRTVKAPPASSDQIFPTDEDTVLNAQLAVTSGYPIIFSQVSGTTAGEVVFHSDGAFTYTPGLNYNGQDHFTFEVSDGHNPPVGPFTTTITINPVYDPPVLALIPDQVVMTGQPVTFTATATDGDTPYGDLLTYSILETLPVGATFNPNTGVFLWTPVWTPAHPGSYTFTVAVHDLDIPPVAVQQEVRIIVLPIQIFLPGIFN